MLIGNRIRLRGIEKDDLPFFVRWLNEPEVLTNIAMPVPRSMGQEERWYADVITKPLIEQPLGIETRDNGSWLLIGNISFMNTNQTDRNAEVGIFIGEETFRNQGNGTEAMSLMLRHGFETLNFERIYLHVHANNPRAIHSYEKCGFVQEGRLRNHHYLQGKYIDVIIMGILRNEWFKQTNGGNE